MKEADKDLKLVTKSTTTRAASKDKLKRKKKMKRVKSAGGNMKKQRGVRGDKLLMMPDPVISGVTKYEYK